MPGVKPFVEVGGDMRQHDLEFDRNGFARDSRALTPRAGTTFEISRKLTGEVSAGYMMRRYQDPTLPELQRRGGRRLADLDGDRPDHGDADRKLARRGIDGRRRLRRAAARRRLQVDHAFRRWLIGTLRFGYGDDQYIGNGREDTRTSLGAAITYKLNREVALKGEYRHETLRSNAANADYDADIFMLGLKLQR